MFVLTFIFTYKEMKGLWTVFLNHPRKQAKMNENPYI